MEFRIKTELETPKYKLSHKDNIMIWGSCFAEYNAIKFKESGFNTNYNPFGILYNPYSISLCFDRLFSNLDFKENELIKYNDLYHSFYHHGSFSNKDKDLALNKINTSFKEARSFLEKTTCVIITLGTSWVYSFSQTGKIVANCHKIPIKNFDRFKLSAEEVNDAIENVVKNLNKINPNINIIFTISPIRHLKDGLHQNNISKATLQLALDEVLNRYDNTYYFPSYEIMIDELRDYRFYADDMVHPSDLAKQYIWEIFENLFFNKETFNIVKQVNKIYKAAHHKPFDSNSEKFEIFAKKNLASIEILKEKEPNINLDNAKLYFNNIINK